VNENYAIGLRTILSSCHIVFTARQHSLLCSAQRCIGYIYNFIRQTMTENKKKRKSNLTTKQLY